MTQKKAQKKKQYTYADVRKSEIKSIWDEDVDFNKVEKLPAREKHRLFPNDFAPSGEPYGDF